MAKKFKAMKRLGRLDELRARLQELEDTLSAIRNGEVDALLVHGPKGDQVYSLNGAEKPYREFIEQMHEGAVALSASGTILYANRRFAEMVGQSLERVMGSRFDDYVAGGPRPLVTRMLGKKKAANATIILQRATGGTMPARLGISPPDAENPSLRFLVVTDLTDQQERKILSEALQNLQTSQSQLQEQYLQLQAIRAKLEAASSAKDQFLAALSHELRTPLTPVLLTANATLVDPTLPAALRADLEMIRRNVELEARLIDDLLDITRITHDKLRITPQPTNLHETLRLALDICHADSQAKHLRFVLELGARKFYVDAEAVRLQQIFWNLIRNAVKFTPEAGVVHVTTENLTGGGARPAIRVIVRDTGIGIEPAAMTRIFEAFQQASGEITRRFGGLGLGLAITKRLVELHGGKIAAVSAGRGKGSTFTIILPTIVAPANKAQLNHQTALKPDSRKLRILLVEDHDDTRRNMTRLLSALHHLVVPARDAAEALEQAALNTFDLVVSDIGLPDESGLELMKKLSQRYQLQGICLSGYGMEEDIAKSREAGFSEHLIKPINFERLEMALTRAIAERPAPRKAKVGSNGRH